MAAEYHNLAAGAFTQDWSNTGLITVDDDWASVPSIIGYRGDGLTAAAAVDPQTVLADGTATPVDVNADEPSPNTFGTGGIAEFAITNPVVAFQGSGTARAPFLLIHLDTTGVNTVNVNYTLRDIDGSADNAVQPVALQYRVGATGNFTNVPAGSVTDASTGPSFATLVTPVSVALPANAANQPQVQVRIITTDAVGSDELIGIDDINITGTTGAPAAGFTVTQTGGNTSVSEAGTTTDTYTIAPNTIPTGAVEVTVTADVETQVSTDGTTFSNTAVLTFTNTTPQTITVRAVDDAEVETATHSGVITHSVTMSADAAYSDALTPIANINVSVTDNDAPSVRIRDIQGAAHVSPLNNQAVSNVAGIVTAVRTNGFYIQDPTPDTNDATSEGVFVFTSSAPTVAVGNSVLVSGTVSEFRADGASGNNLSTTQIGGSPTISVVLATNPLPAAIALGNGGRAIPNQIISNDAVAGTVEDPATVFDPAEDGIDFYESLEGMLVQVNDALAVGPTNNFGEIPVVADNGANASLRTARGGVIIRPTDFNPERIIIDDVIVASPPSVNVGDRFASPIVGVVDYSFSNFKLLNTSALPTVTPGNLQREVTTLAPTGTQLTVATFNVENLDPSDSAGATNKFTTLATRIVNNLRSPDIITVEEIQDNNGATNDAVVDAAQTYQTLITAIAAAGGPTYQFRQIDPVDDQDGGQPGGNIRVGFLFNPARVSFVDRPGGTSTASTTVSNVGGTPQISASPGRLDPANSAFNASRKPLVGEFLFNGQTVYVIANHFNSKGGDQPLFGRFQPPTLTTETQRRQQATIVRDFVQSILAINANANIVVAGDINDFEFSEPLTILKGAGLTPLVETLPAAERYTYNFEGNAQTLDHILVSNNLLARSSYDVVHINSEFADQDSDHDPSVAAFQLTGTTAPPAGFTVTASGGSTSVSEAGTTTDTYTIAPSTSPTGSLAVTLTADAEVQISTDGTTFSNTATLTFTNTTARTVTVRAVDDADVETATHPGIITHSVVSADPAYSNALTPIANVNVSVTDNDVAGQPPVNQTLNGNDRRNRLEGGAGNDTLSGLGGKDVLLGGAGNDLLNGGKDKDTLTGGEGSDRYVYSGRNQRAALANSLIAKPDRIIGFSVVQGDKVVLDFDNKLATANLPRGLFNTGNERIGTLTDAVRSAYADKNQRQRGNQALAANEAVLLKWRKGTYLIVNDNRAGFSPRRDLVANVTGIALNSGDANAGVLAVANYFG